MEFEAIKGIYPRNALILLLVHRAASVQDMDTIIAIANNQQAKHLQHKLFTKSFDKHKDDKFKKVAIIKYPSPHSLLPRSTGLSVIVRRHAQIWAF